MTKNKRSLYALLAACALMSVLLPWGSSPRSAHAEDSHLFPETGKTVQGRFLEYWNLNGGLAQQGYPITDEVQEQSDTDGQIYTMQYFQRSVFEKHPENPRPYDVLLSLLGVFYYNINYGGNAPGQHVNTDNPRLFTETGRTVGGAFREYWESHGGLAQQGFPISEEFTEVSPTDGKSYSVQYFQRAVFEFHPENPAPNNVLLSLLGVFYYGTRHGVVGPPPTATPFNNPTATPTTTPQDNSGQYFFYNTDVGKGVIGHIDPSGNYQDMSSYGNMSTGWTSIVAVGSGRLLFYNKNTGQSVTGQVSNDGKYTDLQASTTLGPGWTHIASAGDGRVLYYKNGTNTGGTAQVGADGSITLLKVYTTFDTTWTHIVGLDGGIYFFYARGTPLGVTLRVEADGSITNLKSYNTFYSQWTNVVGSSNGRLLFYYYITGQGAAGFVDANGNWNGQMNYPDAGTGEPPLPSTMPWVAGGSNATVLFYTDADSSGITARLGGDGSVTILNRYPKNYFAVWTDIVGIK